LESAWGNTHSAGTPAITSVHLGAQFDVCIWLAAVKRHPFSAAVQAMLSA
jgi:hypothetical protein